MNKAVRDVAVGGKRLIVRVEPPGCRHPGEPMAAKGPR
jgi:hypothetical protein